MRDATGLLTLPDVVWRMDEEGPLPGPGIVGKNSCGLASLRDWSSRE